MGASSMRPCVLQARDRRGIQPECRCGVVGLIMLHVSDLFVFCSVSMSIQEAESI
jgi:hypothetical protein